MGVDPSCVCVVHKTKEIPGSFKTLQTKALFLFVRPVSEKNHFPRCAKLMKIFIFVLLQAEYNNQTKGLC